MENNNYLDITQIFNFENKILKTKVINDFLYLVDKDNLYKITDNCIEKIDDNKKFFINAIEVKNDKVLSIYVEDEISFNELSCNIKLSTNSKGIKDVFLFYELGYSIFLYDNNTIDIHCLKSNILITNISFEDEIKDMYKSFKTNELVITFDNKIIILNVCTLIIEKEFLIDDAQNIINATYHDKKLYVIFNDKILITDSESNILNIKLSIKDTISNVFFDIKLHQLIFVTKQNLVYLYHLNSSSLFKVLKTQIEIKDIRFIQHDLYVISDKEVIKYDTTKGVMDFEKNLILKEYEEAFCILNTNPFIISDNYFYEKIKEVWENELDIIANAIFSNDINKAKSTFNKYENFEKFKSEFNNLLNSKESLLSIAKSLRNNDYSEIFSLLKEKPIILKTPIGKKINRDWENTLEIFVNYLLKEKFKENSKEYIMIRKYLKSLDKKIFIDTLITNQDALVSCVNSFKNKNFGLYSSILKKNPYLKKIPLIKKLNSYADTIYKQILTLIEKENFNEALKLSKIWFYFDDTKENAYLLEEKIQVYESFKNSLDKGNIQRCRLILDQNIDHFYDTKYLNVMLNHDLEKIQYSLDYIYNLNLNEAYTILQTFFKSKLWSQKLKYIMKTYYFKLFETKYKEELPNKKILFVSKFYDLFGEVQNEFESFIDISQYPKKNNIKNITNYPKDLL